MAKLDKTDSMLFDLPLDVLGLPKRAVNALRAGGITSFAEIAEWPERELRALPNCGPATIAALRKIAARVGIPFGRRVAEEGNA
jgi:DNA-directed RNA polymerase alpha subunit